MSECVVRMEMPKCCKKCKSTLCLWTIDDCEIMDTIAAVQDFRKENDDGFPDFCPIICQLPEGHGRLIDAEKLKVKKYHSNITHENAVAVAEIDWAETIIPAERKVDAHDAVAPTDTPTDTPTVPAERSET